jgi:hypothetical protein
MATEPTESTVADSQIPATEVEPEVTAPETAEVADQAPEAEKAEEKSPELLRLERELRKAQRINSKLHQRMNAPRPQEVTGQNGSDDPQTIANEIARIDRFTEKANDFVSRGKKAHPDYMESLKSLAAEVGDFVTPNGAPSKFMDVVLQVADEPGALLYHLGKNPDLAEELSDLSDLRLAAKLKLIERDMGEALKPQTVKTAKPLEAVKPINLAKKSPSNMTDAEYAKWRKAR